MSAEDRGRVEDMKRVGYHHGEEEEEGVHTLAAVGLWGFHLLGVGAGVEAGHQVEDVAERHRVQVFNERREKVVDVAATVFQLKTNKHKNS